MARKERREEWTGMSVNYALVSKYWFAKLTKNRQLHEKSYAVKLIVSKVWFLLFLPLNTHATSKNTKRQHNTYVQ